MAAPLLFAVPAVGAVASLAPRLIAEVIERGGDIKGGSNPPGVEAKLHGQKMIDEMKRSADAIRLLKKSQ